MEYLLIFLENKISLYELIACIESVLSLAGFRFHIEAAPRVGSGSTQRFDTIQYF